MTITKKRTLLLLGALALLLLLVLLFLPDTARATDYNGNLNLTTISASGDDSGDATTAHEWSWNSATKVLTLSGAGPYTLTGGGNLSLQPTNVTTAVTLDNVTIDSSGVSVSALYWIASGATVDTRTLTLVGDNILTGGNAAEDATPGNGLRMSGNIAHTLIITSASSASLRAQGGNGFVTSGGETRRSALGVFISGNLVVDANVTLAGIGGNEADSANPYGNTGAGIHATNITNNGTMTGTGGSGGNGGSGGSGGKGGCGIRTGTITNNGTMTATGGNGGSGGNGGNGGYGISATTTTNNGTMHATGGNGGNCDPDGTPGTGCAATDNAVTGTALATNKAGNDGTALLRATVGDTTISGATGSAISGSATITLTNETVVAAGLSDVNAASWFTNLPAGITVAASGTGGGSSITLTFGGTPSATSSAAFAIEIPNSALTGNTALAVTANANAKFSITAAIDTLVTTAAITGVTSPVANATPSTAISNGTGFTAALTWNGSPATFGYSTQYTATITLTAASGYTFSGEFADTAAIAGFTVNSIAPVWESNNGSTLVFKVTFPATGAAPADTTKPTVTSVTPSGTGEELSGQIAITFNEAMSTSVTGTVSITGGTITGGDWSGGNTVYTVNYSGLSNGYTATITISGFEDVAGNVMEEDGTHGFTTKAQPAGPDVSPLTLNITTGDTASFTVSLGSTGATGATVVSTDAGIATVSTASTTGGSVTVNGVSAGNTTITVTFDDAAATEKTVNVTIAPQSITGPPGGGIPSGTTTTTTPPVTAIETPNGTVMINDKGIADGIVPSAAKTNKDVTVYDEDNTKQKADTLPKGTEVTVIGIEGNFAIVQYEKNGETVTGAIAVSAINSELEYPVYGKTTRKTVYLYGKNSKGKLTRTRMRFTRLGSKVKVVGMENGYWIIQSQGETYYVKASELKLVI